MQHHLCRNGKIIIYLGFFQMIGEKWCRISLIWKTFYFIICSLDRFLSNILFWIESLNITHVPSRHFVVLFVFVQLLVEFCILRMSLILWIWHFVAFVLWKWWFILTWIVFQTAQKLLHRSFPLRISSVNVTKSAGNLIFLCSVIIIPLIFLRRHFIAFSRFVEKGAS